MRRLLVVDDDATTLRVVERLLREAGHEVDTCESGPAALVRLRETAYDIVLTDFVMRGMTGTELVRETQRCWPETRCIVVSGYRRLAGIAKDIVWLEKPLDEERLLEAISG